jgi:phosphoglycolate phosphatase-like HAD superfamily hydrolase
LTTLRYSSVLFDLDGTLIDSKTDIVAAVRHALQDISRRPGFGAAADSAEASASSTRAAEKELPSEDEIVGEIGRPLEEVLRNLGYRVSPALERRFVGSFRAWYSRHHADHVRVFPGVEETLSALRRSGVKLGVVTTKQQAQAEAVLRSAGLGRWFDVVRGWEEGRRHKPDPEPVVAAAAALGNEPGSALMVGDTEQDVVCGRAAGASTCAVSYGYRPAGLLLRYRPDFLVVDVRQVVEIVCCPAARGQRVADSRPGTDPNP